MTWTEFKEAWKEASKTEKQDFIMSLGSIIGSTVLILLGACQFAKYANVLGNDYRFAIGGVFVTACGFWALSVTYYLIVCRRVNRLKERIEKIEIQD